MARTTWTVQTPEVETVTTRFVEAVRTYNTCRGPKRLLRNGRPLPMDGPQPSLFEESTCSSS